MYIRRLPLHKEVYLPLYALHISHIHNVGNNNRRIPKDSLYSMHSIQFDTNLHATHVSIAKPTCIYMLVGYSVY